MNILEQIVQHKQEEVTALHRNYSASDFRAMEFFQRQPSSLRASLSQHAPFAIIAEIKRSSPSAGMMQTSIHPADLAQTYAENGAAAISVLTDGKYFSGSIHDLLCVRTSTMLPLLRKDFIIDGLQLYEAKAYGADAVLLIAAILEKSRLNELFHLAAELGLECLIELYDKQEVEKIDVDTMKLIGINNRNLKTMTIDLNHSIELSNVISKDVMLVSESGIHSSEDVKRLRQAHIPAALIGEYFMKSENPGAALRSLLETTQYG